jgi:hypothetical protein
MELPGGFKPNPNLSEFIMCLIMDLIIIWNNVASIFVRIRGVLINCLAISGVFGSTIQVALIHDILFISSVHVFSLYTVVAWVYN